MVFNGEGCATIVLLYTYSESVHGEIMKKERKRGKRCSPDFELGAVGL